jgi:hypothetical protein
MISDEERACRDREDRAIQVRSFQALAWVVVLAVTFALTVVTYMRVERTSDCVQFVAAPHDAPPPGTCKRERTRLNLR